MEETVNRGIVRSAEDEADRLNQAFHALSDIMYSSAYCSHGDPDFGDIMDFEEFCEVHKKLGNWSIKFEEKLKELENKEK